MGDLKAMFMDIFHELFDNTFLNKFSSLPKVPSFLAPPPHSERV